MNSDLPEITLRPCNEDPSHSGPGVREWIVSAALFVLTLLSTSFAGLFYVAGDIGLPLFKAVISEPKILLLGLPFSVPLIGILLAHELGHYLACRHYGIRCTPPYFIPAPITLVGTFGAFIKIKSPFANRRALFDVGIAGPLSGFVFTLPALWVGISLSRIIPKSALPAGQLFFGEPLVFRLFGALILGYSPDTQDMAAHPIAMAAWFGLLVTSLNLMPIWQLDGGHIAYAILGPSVQKKISVGCLAVLIIVSFFGWPTPSYLLFAVLVLILGARMGFYHPPPLQEADLGVGRSVMGLIALLMLVLSFTPVPVTLK